MATYDLFISYSSFDRPWAEKIYNELRQDFPSISVFWDRTSIGAGSTWRTLLTNANINAKHLLILWSDKARDSGEVLNELANFDAEVRREPTLDSSERKVFPISLQGQPPGGMADLQGFPALAQYYEPAVNDRGVSALDTGAASSEFRRAIRMIGDEILKAYATQAVIVAIITTTKERLPLLDQIRGLAQSPSGPTLNEFMAGFSLDWDNVRSRYGANALEWRPFGGPDMIVNLLEDLRVQANSRLDPRYWFRWQYLDLSDPRSTGRIKELHQRASLVLVDPISLFEPLTANIFRGLAEYLRDEASVMASLSPVAQTGVDWFSQAIRAQSVPLLDDYFEPRVPPLSGFAKCALNVQRLSEIERLIRGRIGALEVARKESEARHTTGIGK